MDRKYYCRILGVKDGATDEDIKRAYEERKKRLRSSDYSDEPEYVEQKLKELDEAYRILTGNTVPISPSRKQIKGSNGRKPSRRYEHTFKDRPAKVEINSKGIKSAIAAVVSVILAIASVSISSCDTQAPDYDYDYDDLTYMEANGQAVERVLNREEEYNFFGNLDGSYTVPDDMINWEFEEDDEIMDELWSLNQDLAYSLGISSLSYAIDSYTGIEDYYYEISDYDISQMLTDIMGAPYFEDVAGLMNMYSGEIILDYESYIRFLTDVAYNQTDEICGEPVTY